MMIELVLASGLLLGVCPVVVDSKEPVVEQAAANLKTTLERAERGGSAALKGVRRIVVGVKAEADPLTARVAVAGDEVRLTGATPREAMQACYRFEDELAELKGKPPKPGERTYTRMFSPRMCHSGVEIEKFPDAHMDEIARAGMDAILVYVREPPDVTRNGREDMPALVERAKRHGLDVYVYFDGGTIHDKCLEKHPEAPDAEAYYDRMVGSIVKNAPGIRGMVFVGESCGFVRKDGTDPGFNRFNAVPDWVPFLNLVKKVTRRYNPDLDLVFWTYNFAWNPLEKRRAILEAIPDDVTLHVTWELGDGKTADYSISAVGPSVAFVDEAAIARRRGMRLSTMSNTAGRTWDFGGLDFVPAPYRWLERFRALRDRRKEFGLRALMDTHHYGFVPNPVAALAKKAFTVETADADLEAAIPVEFREPYRLWSEAMALHPATDDAHYGVLRVGPTYPFVPYLSPVPPAPECVGKGNRNNGWLYVSQKAGRAWAKTDPKDFPARIAAAEKEVALWEKGARLMAAVDTPEAKRLLGYGKYCEHTMRSYLNLHRYWLALLENRPAAEVNAILDDEIRNVNGLFPYVEADPRLGWEPSMRRVCGRDCLIWKLAQVRAQKIVQRPLDVIPRPRSVEPGRGALVLEVGADWRACLRAAVTTDAKLDREGYELEVATTGLVVRAGGAAGAFYAEQTLAGCVETFNGAAVIPCMKISDAPRYRYRGLMIDEARHFFGKDEIKKILSRMAELKLNRFHWHLTDDQGWRLKLEKYPELTDFGSWRRESPCWEQYDILDGVKYGPFYYTEEDVREVVDFAARRHIEVIPEFDLPGHVTALLAAHPEFSCRGTMPERSAWCLWGINKDVLCAGNEEAVRFVEGVLDEICRLFPGPTVHVGGDECPKDRWKACPKCQARIRETGVKDEKALQGWLTRRIAEHLERRGKRPMGWDEVLEGVPPKSMLVQSWREGASDQRLAILKAGHEAVMSPVPWCYYTIQPGVKDDATERRGWTLGRTLTVEKQFLYRPTDDLPEEYRKGVIGAESCAWTEAMRDAPTLEWKIFPRLCAFAESLWTAADDRDFADFERRVEKYRRAYRASGINAAPLR